MSGGNSQIHPSAFRWLRNFSEGVLGLLYPRNCVSCEIPLSADGRRWLCEACEARLHRIEPPFCEVCGQTYEGVINSFFRCGNCNDLDIGFDFAMGAYRNEGLARELIHRFKYQREHHLCAPLGHLLADVLEEERIAASLAEGESWLVVPVPLHRRRLREREYNQATELSRVLNRLAAARGIAMPVVNALCRTRYTRRQASLDRADRLTNLKGAFALTKSDRLRRLVEGQSVLLVDDVLTTGATASECARILRDDGGASKIVVITVVRG